MAKTVLLLALLVAMPALVPEAAACAAAGVPCGRIYPSIVIALPEGSPKVFDAEVGTPIVLDATLTYRFDMQNDGYTAAAPNEPVYVTFEFPRKPGWADLKVGPEKLEVPVNDPRQFVVTPDPAGAQAHYVWTAPIKITATVRGQAVLKDGYDFAKLLVFAKSSESGLYQSGYGIKEIRVAPEGAVHESDVAGNADVFTASPLPPLDLAPVESSFGGTTATLTPPDAAQFWQPARWTVGLSPVPKGRAFLALHDEAGNLVVTEGPIPAAAAMGLNATLAKPGLHTVTLTLLPDAGSLTPPMTFALPFQAGATDAEGHAFAKTYLVQTTSAVPAPTGNAAEPLVQWERDVPFFAFDNAQSVSVLFTLRTPGAPLDLGRGLANVQLLLLDPDGNLLAQNSVDAVNPQRPMRVGSVPQEGWFVLRLRGAGAPAGASWDARIEVAYPSPPEARNRADGAPDETGGLLRMAGRNLTLPLEAAAVWQPSDARPLLDGIDAPAYALTIFDANGTLAYASGLRTGDAMFTPPAPGSYRAFAYAEPTAGSSFPPLVRAFTVLIGEGQSVTAATFTIEDAPLAPTSASETLLAIHAVPVPQAGAEMHSEADGATVKLTDADGAAVESPTEPGTYYALVSATNAGPPKAIPIHHAASFTAPVTLVGPDTLDPAAKAAKGLSVPGLAVGAVLVVAGLVAVGIALARRP